MATKFNVIRTTAFEVPPEGLGVATHVIDFPDGWLSPLRSLARTAQRSEKAAIPIRSLNEALRALVPDLSISLASVANKSRGDQPWLVSTRPLSTERLMPIVDAWIRSQQKAHVSDSLIADVIAVVRRTSLVSVERKLDELTPGGGAAPLRIVESQAATLLSMPGNFVDLDGARLEFVRCAAADGVAGELMTWPPLPTKNDQTYSIILRASAQTVPGEANPLLYLHFGVRRWMARKPFIAPRNGTTVYFRAKAPYLEDTRTPGAFVLARAISVARFDAGELTYGFAWNGSLIGVLDRAGLTTKVPDINALMAAPADFLRNKEAPASIPFRPGRSRGKDGVSPGINAQDRNTLLDWAAAVMGAATPVAPLERAPHDAIRTQPEKRGGTLSRGSIVASLASTVGQPVIIELLTSSEASTGLALRALSTRLGSADAARGDTDQPHFANLGIGGASISRPDFAGWVSAPLEAPANGKDPSPANSRVQQIATGVPPVTAPVVSIVEIEPAARFAVQGIMPRRDPKNAIRHGLARTGRLTQFVHPIADGQAEPSTADVIRFENAVDDAFRQLGVRPSPFRLRSPTLEIHPQYLAIWMLRRNKRRFGQNKNKVALPVAVLLNSDGTDIRVRTAMDAHWRPLHQAEVWIGKFCGGQAALTDGAGGSDFVSRVIGEITADGSPTLLLTGAQNFRLAWKHLQNPNIGVDVLTFQNGGECPIAHFPGLRHVRIRTQESYETPEGYGYIEEATGADAVGKTRGLWSYRGDRLFLSTARKADTDQTAKGTTKLPRPGSGLRGINKLVSNPQLVEIYVAAIQEGDDPAAWAALAHELRDGNPYFSGETVLPWPLQIAKQLGEYISPVYVEPDDDSVIGAAIEIGDAEDSSSATESQT